MKKVGRTLSAAATTIGLALVATGCASNVIGDDGPQPGIAAQVEDSDITIDDLSAVTDGLCTLQAADESVPGTSRAYAETQILEAWVTALVDAEYADAQDLDVTPPDPGLELAPGWDDVDEDDRDALRDYADAFVYSTAVREAAGEETPDPADYDIVINPRFDARLDGGKLVQAGQQLSVPVSDDAGSTAFEAPSAEVVAELPDDQLCGNRPDPQAQPPIPMG